MERIMKKGRKAREAKTGVGERRGRSRGVKDEAKQQKRELRRRERGRGGRAERKIERDHVTRLI